MIPEYVPAINKRKHRLHLLLCGNEIKTLGTKCKTAKNQGLFAIVIYFSRLRL